MDAPGGDRPMSHPESRIPHPRLYQSSQYDALMRKVLLGWVWNRSFTSPLKLRVPATGSNASRPWVQTTYRVEPGRYSHRSTRLERNSLKLNPPGLLVTAVSP